MKIKQSKTLLNSLTESLECGFDDPGKFVAETLALRSLRDIDHVIHDSVQHTWEFFGLQGSGPCVGLLAIDGNLLYLN
jgi:hypothetical protein